VQAEVWGKRSAGREKKLFLFSFLPLQNASSSCRHGHKYRELSLIRNPGAHHLHRPVLDPKRAAVQQREPTQVGARSAALRTLEYSQHARPRAFKAAQRSTHEKNRQRAYRPGAERRVAAALRNITAAVASEHRSAATLSALSPPKRNCHGSNAGESRVLQA